MLAAFIVTILLVGVVFTVFFVFLRLPRLDMKVYLLIPVLGWLYTVLIQFRTESIVGVFILEDVRSDATHVPLFGILLIIHSPLTNRDISGGFDDEYLIWGPLLRRHGRFTATSITIIVFFLLFRLKFPVVRLFTDSCAEDFVGIIGLEVEKVANFVLWLIFFHLVVRTQLLSSQPSVPVIFLSKWLSEPDIIFFGIVVDKERSYEGVDKLIRLNIKHKELVSLISIFFIA
jgi:hypothetical protein